MSCSRAVILVLLPGALVAPAGIRAADPSWTSPMHARVLLNVDSRGVIRSNSPATVSIDCRQSLLDQRVAGTFDENTIEVLACDSNGQPVVFDTSRSGYEQYLLPWRIEKYYGISRVNLSFVLPSHSYNTYAVYFDTEESGLGKPQRYSGVVGDGDRFREEYKRREIAPTHFDSMCDLDGDGDLDLFTGGVEPFIYCYENVGGNRFVERGRLTSGGDLLVLPHAPSNRSWVVPALLRLGRGRRSGFLSQFHRRPLCRQDPLLQERHHARGKTYVCQSGCLDHGLRNTAGRWGDRGWLVSLDHLRS